MSSGSESMICTVCGARFPGDTLFCPDDGTRVVPVASTVDVGQDIDLTGERIFGDYMIRKRLGTGGMGAVYLAEHLSIEQQIAIKVLHPAGDASEEMFKRFVREAQTISRLTHPNIIRVFIFGKTERGLLYLAMEYVSGRTLRQVLEESPQMPPLRAINIMRQALHALSEAHDLGIIHRDLKPDNIMLTRFRGVDDYVKLLDFGIAKVKESDAPQDSKLTQAGVVYGTPEYLSPEQARAQDLTPAADVYSMGIILYELITGTVPFTGSTSMSVLAAHVYEKAPKPSTVTDRHIDPELERIIMKAIAKKPSKRYGTVLEMLDDLETWEARAHGKKARRTTMLKPDEVSVIYEVTREASRSAEVDVGAGVPSAGSTAETREVPGRSVANAPAPGAAAPPQATSRPAPPPPAPAAPPATRNNTPWLILIGVLVVAVGALIAILVTR